MLTSENATPDAGEEVSPDVLDAAVSSAELEATPAPAPSEPPATAQPVNAPLFQPPDPALGRPRRRAASRPAGSPSTPAAPTASPGTTDTRGAGPEAAATTPQSDAVPAGPQADDMVRSDDESAPGEAPEPGDAASNEATPTQPTDAAAEGPAADADAAAESSDVDDAGEGAPDGAARRRRRRGGRRRRRSGGSTGDSGAESEDGTEAAPGAGAQASESGQDDSADSPSASDAEEAGTSASSRRRRRRRRRGEETVPSEDDPANTTVRVREGNAAEDEITSVHGSTRLEAKKQRRREGREAGRRRAPVISEAEFLARRESVEREMVVRRRGDLMQIAVLEDNMLAEHYVARGTQTSMIGNIYLGRVQNVLPSMEAAFIDIGKGRNAVLYAGEVDWKALSGEGKPRRIEDVLSSGQSVLVQVTKDPVGHKGARLTSQVSLAGRFLVYVPGGHTSGISRKLPDTERSRLKSLLKDIVPAEAGVIVRTAAEGATEEQLTRDVAALTARWEDVNRKATGQGPKLLYAEPDLMIKVVRDLYNEDFKGLTVQGDEAWEDVQSYVEQVAPDLGTRLRHWDDDTDVFAAYRIDEQIAKGTDRKVWLPSGGSLVIDRTEAMTVVDVNTGKFTGSGGNLEETVTKNNLEAAEEIVRQLRLRDIGGIIVIDFIDMVLEDNRDLVLRRLVECLGRDRTRHQVAEVTSLGLVQMTRKRIGTGLLEAFSEPCTCCQGRGLHVLTEPVLPDAAEDDEDQGRSGGRARGRTRSDRGRSDETDVAPSVRVPALDPRLRPKLSSPPAAPIDSAEGTEATETESAQSARQQDASGTNHAHSSAQDPDSAAAAVEVLPAEAAPALVVADDEAASEQAPAKPKRTRRSRSKSAADKAAAAAADSAEAVPAETAPVEDVPGDSASAESGPAATVPADPAPAESAPAESAPAESAPAESAPDDSVPDSVPGDLGPAAPPANIETTE